MVHLQDVMWALTRARTLWMWRDARVQLPAGWTPTVGRQKHWRSQTPGCCRWKAEVQSEDITLPLKPYILLWPSWQHVFFHPSYRSPFVLDRLGPSNDSLTSTWATTIYTHIFYSCLAAFCLNLLLQPKIKIHSKELRWAKRHVWHL